MTRGSALLALFLFSIATLGGCANRSCEALCKEAQEGDCTSIKGDCDQFCASLTRVEGPSGCTDQHNAYLDCLNSESNACDPNCDAQDSALSKCVATWCLSHASDADCQTLAKSF